MGSLALDEVVMNCDEFYSEVVPRQSNRVVVLSPKETFRFENYVDTPPSGEKNKSFFKSTQLALVYVFV